MAACLQVGLKGGTVIVRVLPSQQFPRDPVLACQIEGLRSHAKLYDNLLLLMSKLCLAQSSEGQFLRTPVEKKPERGVALCKSSRSQKCLSRQSCPLGSLLRRSLLFGTVL